MNEHYNLTRRQITLGLKKAEIYVETSLNVDVPSAPETFKKLKEAILGLELADE